MSHAAENAQQGHRSHSAVRGRTFAGLFAFRQCPCPQAIAALIGLLDARRAARECASHVAPSAFSHCGPCEPSKCEPIRVPVALRAKPLPQFFVAAIAFSEANIRMFCLYHHVTPCRRESGRIRIEHAISTRIEEPPPVFRPLFVDVAGSSLPGDRRGEQNHRSRLSQRCHDVAARLRRKVFKHFEADGKIVIPGKFRQFRKIGRYKTFGGNEQRVAINVISIEALNEVHADLLEGPQPCATTAADIQDTSRAE